MPRHQIATVAELRASIAGVCAPARRLPPLPFGIDPIDRRLAGGGLDAGGLHEVAPSAPQLVDDAAATLFVAGLAARFVHAGGNAIWALTRFDLYAPGIEQVGLGPDRVFFVEAREDAQVLAAMEDALRDGSVAAVVGEVKRADMTATRRLQLAAAESCTPALLLRRWPRAGRCPLIETSAATTRWRIGCAPSSRIGMAGIGRSCWNVELVRQRNGDPFSLILEGCDGEGRLALPAAIADRTAAQAGAAARAV